MIKKYIDKIVSNNKQEDMDKLSEMLVEIIYKMKEPHHEKYEYYKSQLYEMAEGKIVSEEMAHEWVEEMKPIGEHWTMEQTTNAMNSLGYKDRDIDFYVVANMIYNDYYELVKDNEELALKMAHSWINDEDAKEDKLYCYYKHIIKRD